MTLHDYQKRCADFIAAHTNCILSVDMGLGKKQKHTLLTLF